MLTQTEISQDENGIAIVTLAGRLTLGNSMNVADSKINDCIDSQGARKLIFDLTGITHIDSAGLSLIVFTHARLKLMGGQLRLAGPTPRVMQLFQVTLAERILQIDPDLQTSVEKLRV